MSPRAPADRAGTLILDLDLSRPLPQSVDLAGRPGAVGLVRLHGIPLGWLEVDAPDHGCLDGEHILEALGRTLGPEIAMGARVPGFPVGDGDGDGTAPPVDVVVCTRDRPESLARCLRTLARLDYPDARITVVDSASRGDETRVVAREAGVRYLRERLPGLDRARNRGIEASDREIVAFTDDDVEVDPRWLRGIAGGFSDPDVGAVTGLVAPASLATSSQALLEFGYGGMVARPEPARVSRGGYTWDLLWISAYGCGANMAFRRETLVDVGGFDPALDVGTPTGGGGDLDMLLRVVSAGYVLAYRPEAVVWHHHREDPTSLRRQLHNNGRGFGAYLISAFRRGELPRRSIVSFAVRQWFGWWLVRRLLRPRAFPRSLVRAELGGALSSPLHYLRASLSVRAADPPGPTPEILDFSTHE